MTSSSSFKVKGNIAFSHSVNLTSASFDSLRCFALEFTTRLNGLNLAFRPCGALNLGNPRTEGERQTTQSWAGFLSFNFMFVALASVGESTMNGYITINHLVYICLQCFPGLSFPQFVNFSYCFSCICFEGVFLNHSWNLFRYFSGFLHPSPAATEAWTNRLHRHIPSGEILSCGVEGRSAISPRGFCQCWK